MAEPFLSIYRFFSTHKLWMWISMLGSFLLFSIFALNIRFEENLLKLFPDTEKNRETAIAFGNIRVKDKIFVEIMSREGCTASTETIVSATDCFIDSLVAHDGGQFIDCCLWKFDQDMAMNGLDFFLNNAADFVDERFYPIIEGWIRDGAPEKVPEELMSMLSEYTGDYALIDAHLFSPDSLAAVAYISPTFNSMDTKYGGRLLKKMESEVEAVCELYPEVCVVFHGAAIEGAFNARRIKSDLVLTLILSLTVICLVIGFSFKNKSTLLLLLLPIVYGSVFSLAVIYLIKGEMSLMAIGLGAIILGTALSYCLHVLTHYKYVSDPEIVLREQSRPVCLGCLTTLGAFTGLLFTTSDLLRDFGLFALFALLGSTVFALVFLPHFFNPAGNIKSYRAFQITDKLNSVRFDSCYPLAIVLVIIIVICFFLAPKVHFDPDLDNLGYMDNDVQFSENYYCEHIDGGKPEVYYAGTGGSLDEAILCSREIVSVLDSLETAGIVKSRSHMSDMLIPQDEQVANIERWKQYWTGREIPNYLPSLAYSLIEADYEPVSLPESGALPEEFLSNIVEQTSDGTWMVFIMARMDRKDSRMVSDYVTSIEKAIVIDPYYYTEDMLKIIHSDFNIVLLISSIFVLSVLLLSFRNIIVTLIAFMPMFLSWFVVQGIMALLGIDFNLFNIIISSFIFGVGVDYSIFVMDGLIDIERGGNERLLLYHKAAILFSAFVLLTVIISMLFTSHPCIHSIGVVTVIGMVSTLLITYTLEPLLFRMVKNYGLLKKK